MNGIHQAYGAYSGNYKKSNNYFEARVAHIWKLKDEKIISFEQFVDSQSVNDALISAGHKKISKPK